MFIHEYGDKNDPLVLLLAPMMVSGEDLYRLIHPYFRRNYHFIAPDQGGHGKAGAYISADEEYKALLDNPLTALGELNRVCKDGGMLIIPTYMNKDGKGKTSGFAGAVGKAGADFKRQFTLESYRQFFLDAGYPDVRVSLADGRIPCAVAVMRKASK